MVVLLVATLGLIAAVALAFWPSRDEPAEPDRAATASPESGPAEPAAPSSLEGVLTAQLIAGEITRSQYLRAQEQIAARDEERHPMSVPRDAHP
jgi:hypothetical protein